MGEIYLNRTNLEAVMAGILYGREKIAKLSHEFDSLKPYAVAEGFVDYNGCIDRISEGFSALDGSLNSHYNYLAGVIRNYANMDKCIKDMADEIEGQFPDLFSPFTDLSGTSLRSHFDPVSNWLFLAGLETLVKPINLSTEEFLEKGFFSEYEAHTGYGGGEGAVLNENGIYSASVLRKEHNFISLTGNLGEGNIQVCPILPDGADTVNLPVAAARHSIISPFTPNFKASPVMPPSKSLIKKMWGSEESASVDYTDEQIVKAPKDVGRVSANPNITSDTAQQNPLSETVNSTALHEDGQYDIVFGLGAAASFAALASMNGNSYDADKNSSANAAAASASESKASSHKAAAGSTETLPEDTTRQDIPPFEMVYDEISGIAVPKRLKELIISSFDMIQGEKVVIAAVRRLEEQTISPFEMIYGDEVIIANTKQLEEQTITPFEMIYGDEVNIANTKRLEKQTVSSFEALQGSESEISAGTHSQNQIIEPLTGRRVKVIFKNPLDEQNADLADESSDGETSRIISPESVSETNIGSLGSGNGDTISIVHRDKGINLNVTSFETVKDTDVGNTESSIYDEAHIETLEFADAAEIIIDKLPAGAEKRLEKPEYIYGGESGISAENGDVMEMKGAIKPFGFDFASAKSDTVYLWDSGGQEENGTISSPMELDELLLKSEDLLVELPQAELIGKVLGFLSLLSPLSLVGEDTGSLPKMNLGNFYKLADGVDIEEKISKFPSAKNLKEHSADKLAVGNGENGNVIVSPEKGSVKSLSGISYDEGSIVVNIPALCKELKLTYDERIKDLISYVFEDNKLTPEEIANVSVLDRIADEAVVIYGNLSVKILEAMLAVSIIAAMIKYADAKDKKEIQFPEIPKYNSVVNNSKSEAVEQKTQADDLGQKGIANTEFVQSITGVIVGKTVSEMAADDYVQTTPGGRSINDYDSMGEGKINNYEDSQTGGNITVVKDTKPHEYDALPLKERVTFYLRNLYEMIVDVLTKKTSDDEFKKTLTDVTAYFEKAIVSMEDAFIVTSDDPSLPVPETLLH